MRRMESPTIDSQDSAPAHKDPRRGFRERTLSALGKFAGRLFRRQKTTEDTQRDLEIRPSRRRLNIDLALLALLLLAINELYRGDRFLPLQETAQAFQGFHYFYSHFYHVGEMPRWSLYGTFGAPSGFWQLLVLTPASYVCIVLGRLLQVENVLALFKLSITLEQFILLLGLYKLGRLLYERRAPVFLVCAGVVGSLVWCTEIWSYFRVYYLLPLMLYFAISFFIRKRPRYLWFAGATVILSLVGNPLYYVFLWLVLLGVTALVLTAKDRTVWSSLTERSLSNLVPLVGFLLLAAAYVAFLRYSLTHTEVASDGFDSLMGKMPVLASTAKIEKLNLRGFLRMFVFSWSVHTNWSQALQNAVYVGLLPFLLVVYAIGKVRDARFYALAIAALLLIWLSMDHASSWWVSHVSGLSLLLHPGRVYGMARILILLCAGFGLEQLLRNGKGRHVLYTGLALMFLTDLLSDKLVLTSLDLPINFGRMSRLGRSIWFLVFWSRTAFYALMAGCGIASVVTVKAISAWRKRRGRSPAPSGQALRRFAAVGIIAFYVLDVFLFQIVVTYSAPPVALTPDRNPEAIEVGRLRFPDGKEHKPTDERSWHAIWLMSAVLKPYTRNEMTYSFAEYDASRGYSDVLLWPAGPRRLFEARARVPDYDPPFARVLGWSGSKFRLMTNPVFVNSAEEGAEIIRTTKALDEVLILRGMTTRPRTPGGSLPSSESRGKVEVRRATANEVTVETHVTTDEPTWLVYADAFHPGWRATVNGEETPIAEAYLAFKAVPVSKGKSVVRFTFDGSWVLRIADLIPVIGIGFYIYIVVEFLILLFRPHRPRASTG